MAGPTVPGCSAQGPFSKVLFTTIQDTILIIGSSDFVRGMHAIAGTWTLSGRSSFGGLQPSSIALENQQKHHGDEYRSERGDRKWRHCDRTADRL
jgi:hypothetical protein